MHFPCAIISLCSACSVVFHELICSSIVHGLSSFTCNTTSIPCFVKKRLVLVFVIKKIISFSRNFKPRVHSINNKRNKKGNPRYMRIVVFIPPPIWFISVGARDTSLVRTPKMSTFIFRSFFNNLLSTATIRTLIF